MTAGSPDGARVTANVGHANRSDDLAAALSPLLDAVGALVIAPEDATASDITIDWRGHTVVVRLPTLSGALDRLIEQVETELGGRLALLSRSDKQLAVRLLDERGAFTLRRSVDDVADVLGVSRITVYNYLNAIHR